MDDNAAHGVRVSGNDHFTVMAINNFEYFILLFAPYETKRHLVFPYVLPNLYVYSVTVVPNNENETYHQIYRFMSVARDRVNLNVFIILHEHDRTTDQNHNQAKYVRFGNIPHQEYMFIKIHPSLNIAYVFMDTYIASIEFDVTALTLTYTEFKSMTELLLPTFRIRAVDVTDSYAILIGFDRALQTAHLSVYVSLLIKLNPFQYINKTDLKDIPLTSSLIISYNRHYDMSIDMNPTRQIAIVGLPMINKVIQLGINTISSSFMNWTLTIKRVDVASSYYTGFGRSIAWIDNITVAIAVLTVPNRPWSQSEIWVYNVDQPFTIPLFVFPNNQQTIALQNSPLFLQIFSWSENLFIVTDQYQHFLVPTRSSGFSSVWRDNPSHLINIFESAPCIPGTYKDTSSFGPCTLCQSQTKNTGHQPCSKCEPCASSSYCPLGSTNEVLLKNYPSFTQTFTYPDSPNMNNYDDLLVQNTFTINVSRRCLVISPIFWAALAVILCFIIWFLMILPKICNCPKGHSRRQRAKQFLKRADIINEGERWIGGLFSFAIILLFAFTSWFASEYLKLYPIETSPMSSVSCDDKIRNAAFDSSLQLPLPNPDGNQWDIFQMLDDQIFTMTVDLINTAAYCSNITVQQNRPGVMFLRLETDSCILQTDNVTRSIRFQLPSHRTNIQINVTGPFFVGGMRLCLHSTGRIQTVHTLQSLDTCQLFINVNQTLSHMTSLYLVLIKVINFTKPLKVGGDTLYHGRWAPTFAESSLSDALLYQQNGEYLRYTFPRTIISITLSEQPFYLQNTQEPIIRQAELAFHTLLFCTLIVEIFAMAFLLFRLIIIPLIRAIFRCRDQKNTNEISNE